MSRVDGSVATSRVTITSKIVVRSGVSLVALALAAIACRIALHALNPSPRTREAAFAWADERALRGTFYTLFADLTKDTSNADAEEYLALADAIAARGLGEGVSLKPQQLGANGTRQVCLHAAARNSTCIISAYRMEHAASEFEIAMSLIRHAKELELDPSHIGLCLVVDAPSFATQVHRMRAVLDAGGLVRLVKGGWYSGAATSHTEWSRVTRRFVALATIAVRHGFGDRLLLATHDLAAIDAINGLTNSSANDYAMFRSAYVRGHGARVGIFYGKRQPFYQVLNDLGKVNLLLRLVGVRALGVDVTPPAMTEAIAEAEALFVPDEAPVAMASTRECSAAAFK